MTKLSNEVNASQRIGEVEVCAGSDSGSVVTIRCLSALPEEVEALIAKIAEEEAAESK